MSVRQPERMAVNSNSASRLFSCASSSLIIIPIPPGQEYPTHLGTQCFWYRRTRNSHKRTCYQLHPWLWISFIWTHSSGRWNNTTKDIKAQILALNAQPCEIKCILLFFLIFCQDGRKCWYNPPWCGLEFKNLCSCTVLIHILTLNTEKNNFKVVNT